MKRARLSGMCVIPDVEEAGLADVAALHDVQGNSIQMDARAARYGGMVAWKKESLAPLISHVA